MPDVTHSSLPRPHLISGNALSRTCAASRTRVASRSSPLAATDSLREVFCAVSQNDAGRRQAARQRWRRSHTRSAMWRLSAGTKPTPAIVKQRARALRCRHAHLGRGGSVRGPGIRAGGGVASEIGSGLRLVRPPDLQPFRMRSSHEPRLGLREPRLPGRPCAWRQLCAAPSRLQRVISARRRRAHSSAP